MSRCRSCMAPIEWARTQSGSRIPLDLGDHDDGSIVLGDDGIARVVASETPARRSHFQSCPNAAEHRSKRSAKKSP